MDLWHIFEVIVIIYKPPVYLFYFTPWLGLIHRRFTERDRTDGGGRNCERCRKGSEIVATVADTSGVRSGHATHTLHDQIFRDCMG